ncbi:hypothetical protein KY312_01870 [Candidatus Woesearchaeota archaeon]|nr:hypothetical protein [Candidatus Woesearchaeota archaeon]
MVWNFRQAIQDLSYMGFFDIILPFFLIFTVIYAILQRSNILGSPEEARKFNVIVAMVIGLLVIVPHVMWGDPTGQSPYLSVGSVAGRPVPDVVNIINRAVPQISVWIIAVLMLMILLGMFGSKIELWQRPMSTWIFVAAVIIVFYTFAVAANWLNTPEWLSWLRDRGNQAVLLILLIFGIVIWFVVAPEKPKGQGLGQKIGEAFEKIVKP